MHYFLSLLAGLLWIACTRGEPERTPTIQQGSVDAAAPRFDSQRAFAYLKAQTDFGPRNPGSTGHRNCLNFLQSELQSLADAVNTQPFTITGYDKETLNLTNVIASFNLKATTRILLLAHWDTRPRADQEKDEKKRNLPILGANDGASGVAVLLEIAQNLKAHPPRIGVDILLVDGEDYGKGGDSKYYLLGARHFAQHLPVGFMPSYAILVDMVGDSQLEIPKERYSLEYAPEIVELVWSAARELGVKEFVDAPSSGWTTDDHIPLNQAGIRCIDLIDFDYPDKSNRYWHTLEDTPDKCSPGSLEAVGKVLLHLLYTTKP